MSETDSATGTPVPELVATPAGATTGLAEATVETAAVEAAVEGAEPARRPGLSPSRANDFMQCPLLFRFRTIDRLPEPPSPAAVRGTLVHAVLERLFDAPAGARTLDAARALLPAAWEAIVADRPDCADLPPDGDVAAWFADAETLLARYFTLEDPNRLQPAERELVVRTELDDGLELRGVVDRLDVAPDGAMRVVDYKTGRSPGPGFESGALFQMRFYALVLSRLRGRMPAMLQLVYLGDGTVLRHQPTLGELTAVEQRIRAVWSGIRTAAETGRWEPRASALCGFCAHQALCPLFGGTPPEPAPDAVEHAVGVRPVAAVG